MSRETGGQYFTGKLRLDPRDPESQMVQEGLEGEKVVVKLLQSIPGITVRKATEIEDSGKQIALGQKGLAIDAFGYIDGRPAIGFQITISNNDDLRERKVDDLKNRSFMRLPEMRQSDTAIPRVLVFVDHIEMRRVLTGADKDIARHPNIERQVRESVLASLGYVFTKTRDPKEQQLIQKLMTIFALKA